MATSYTTPAGVAHGLEFGFDVRVHFLATEPRETILKIGAIVDGDVEVAYETAVLGILRPGYRCFQLRSPYGTRIELCACLCQIAISDEAHPFAEARELRELIERQRALIAEQAARIEELERLVHDEQQTR